MDIIPAIDLIGGSCVRLRQGDYSQQTVYEATPLEMARAFEQTGIRRLHMVDLDGARTGKMANLNILEEIASHTNLVIDFGGGIQTDEDIAAVFDAGAQLAVTGSIAVKKPEIVECWIERYGPEKILPAADVVNGYVATSGWQQTSQVPLMDFIGRLRQYGLNALFCTDVSKDGLLLGPSLPLYRSILEAYPGLGLIASGGVSSVSDLHQLQAAGCQGVIIGKALYENRISLTDLQSFL